MGAIAVLLKIDEKNVVHALHDAGDKLDGAGGEVVVDFSSLNRVDPAVLDAMEKFSQQAADMGVKVALRGVNIEVYKVLKLVKLTSRFSFVN